MQINWTETSGEAQVQLLITHLSFSLSLYMVRSHSTMHTNKGADEYAYSCHISPFLTCNPIDTAHTTVYMLHTYIHANTCVQLQI